PSARTLSTGSPGPRSCWTRSAAAICRATSSKRGSRPRCAKRFSQRWASPKPNSHRRTTATTRSPRPVGSYNRHPRRFSGCGLRAMEERNFALGVAYAKTEILQVALFGFVLLGDRVSLIAIAAMLVATAGVLLVSLPTGSRSLAAIARGWTSRAALLGIGSGAAFGMAAVGYRGAALALATPSIVLAAAYSLVWAQALQTVLLGG